MAVHLSLIAIGLIFFAVGGYHRIQSQRSGESLDRTKEGWPILIGIRLAGLLTLGATAAWLWNPASFEWATFPLPEGVRWVGVAGLACSVAWLIWMFRALGRNLTDTVVTRRDAKFVNHGPYRLVRNPMYTGILAAGLSIGLALGTWLLPLGACVTFALLALRTRTEERYLIERFGDQYRHYMAHVGRFIPRLGPVRSHRLVNRESQ
jgi:protein-S-isoprenylcysteine O-methyltransferase Ste14